MRYHEFCYFRCLMLNVILVDIAKDLIQDIQDDCTNLGRWHKTHLEYVHSGEQLLPVGNYGFNNFFRESMWYCPTFIKQWDSGLYFEIVFYFKHCRTKTFPVLICDNSYWTSVIFYCRRLVKNRQRLCTTTVYATITFTVAAIATSVLRAYMRVIIKGERSSFLTHSSDLRTVFMSLSHSALCFPRYTMTLWAWDLPSRPARPASCKWLTRSPERPKWTT